MRIRTIKPEFWRHEDLSSLPEATHLLAAALLNYADDEGFFNANHKLIQAECSPLREPSVSIHDSLNLLVQIGFIRLGLGANGRHYGHVVSFNDHQVINRPTPSKISELDIDWDASLITHTQLSEPSLPERKGREQGREGKGKGTGNADFDEFYSAYPHKIGKANALKAFQSARKRAGLQEIMDGLRSYIDGKPIDRPWCNPATWLNQDRWADQPAPPASAAAQVSPLMAACDRTIAMAERFADPFGEITTDVDPLQIPDLSIPDFLRRN
jgi:hypothetical protein